MVPLYAIFMLVFSPLTLVLISVTIEREQKILESLILQPLKRKAIVTGKLLYGIILVGFNTFLFLLAIFIFLLDFYFLAPDDLKRDLILVLESIIANTDFSVWLFIIYMLIGLMLVSILMLAAAVLFSLMAKDEREANMVISMVIMIPLFGIMFLGFLPITVIPEYLQILIGAIPMFEYFTSVYTVLKAGEIVVWAWVSLAFQAFWVLVAVWAAGRLIESEGILEISFKQLFRFRR